MKPDTEKLKLAMDLSDEDAAFLLDLLAPKQGPGQTRPTIRRYNLNPKAGGK